MAGAVIAPEFETWSVPGHSLRIDYSAQVMDELRIAAVEGYHQVPHGGVETGGVLFGTHSGNVVRITAWRPISCGYSKGPSFVLTDEDQAALEKALKTWRAHPDLSGLEPVGWCHAHTRSEIFLSEADLALFDRFFPKNWQVALVLRPASFAPTRAGFFFREQDGIVHAEASYHEFALAPARGRQIASDPLEPEPAAAV